MIVTVTVSCPTLTTLYHHIHHQETDVPADYHQTRRRLFLIRQWLENTLLDDYVTDRSILDNITQDFLDALCQEVEHRLEKLFPHGDWLAIVPVDTQGTIVVLMALDG